MKVLLGMSGGLDSTYAAIALRESGHEVVGAVLQMHDYTDTAAAARAAAAVGVPLVTVDMRAPFRDTVERAFTEEYLCGRTPNPCVVCNRYVKFEGLVSYARQHGFDRIATGHYSRIVRIGDRYAVSRAADPKKDQSYVLWGLTQAQLSMLITPLADCRKEEIRRSAAERGLEVAEAEESMEICFIPDHDYARYIEERRGKLPEGNFLDWNGKVVGRHRGIVHYTVGQRKHLGIALGEPVYVSAIDPKANTVTLARAGGEYALSAHVSSLQFQALAPCSAGTTVNADVKIRYSAQPAPSKVTFDASGAEVLFASPVRAVTPGQSAVFYDEDGNVLFGGLID